MELNLLHLVHLNLGKRTNARITLPNNYTLFVMISPKQTLYGITSVCLDEPKEKHLHYIFIDFDKCTLEEATKKLLEVQKEFHLGDFSIYSDKEGSYRAISWSKREWTTYLHVLLHCFPLLDYGFWVWTVRRGAATIRYSRKICIPPLKIVKVLKGYEQTSFPEHLRHAKYDTGIEKEGRLITIG